MIKFEKEELLKIAELSALKLDEDQIEAFAHDLQEVLNYTSELDQVEPPQTLDIQAQVNVFREDIAHSFPSEEVLDQAPNKKGHYFVVPKIL